MATALNDAALTFDARRSPWTQPLSYADRHAIEAISAAYEARIRAACPRGLEQAMPLFDRIGPKQWTLEWSLPTWLGRSLGVPEATVRQIVLSNVFGLAFVRLQDDLADGEAASSNSGTSAELRTALYEAALVFYRREFPPQSPFWTRLKGWMTEWRAATDSSAGSLGLAARGAPLKISAFATSLIARDTDRFSQLEACLDHTLTAMVMYDHFCDWREDLAGGRWNAFTAATGARTSTDVLVAMLTTDVVANYFRMIDFEIEQAHALADVLRIEGLSTHLAALASDMREQSRDLESRYRRLADRGEQLVFGHNAA